MFKSSHSDPKSSQKKPQKSESHEERMRKQKMKPVKKDKYKPGTRYQEVDEDEE